MRFVLLGTSIPEENMINLWGLDVDTYLVVNILSDKSIAKHMKMLYEYDVECTLAKEGIPRFTLTKVKNEKTFYDENMKGILDYVSSDSLSFLLDQRKCMIIKADKCNSINIYDNYIEAMLSIVGIRDREFCVEIKDWRWSEYWKNQSIYANQDLIKTYMNRKNVYLLMDYDRNIAEKALKCVSMLVM